MVFGFFPKRFAGVLVSTFLLPLASPCWADMPPLGYVGPAPVTTTSTVSPVLPLGYVGPAPTSATPTLALSTPKLPLGYIGVVPAAPATTKTPLPFDISTATPPIGYIGPVAHDPAASKPRLLPAKPAEALATEQHTGETLITAQQMHSDSTTGIMTATGKVELVRGGYVLHADKVIYNQKTGIMTAEGHVAMLTPTGEVQFAQHEEITGDMKQAFATQMGILFPDNSRMAAVSGQRYDERYTLAHQASYTACNICRDDPDNPPLWQMRADSITHDNEEHVLYYHNATIDFAGVPVAYTPYMSGPDPTVKRLQGFLTPTAGYTPNIGAYAKAPYYFDIAPDKDATLTPTMSTTDGLQMAGEYRERFDNGKLNLNGSVTQADLIDDQGIDKGQKIRGDLFGSFLYDIDSTWRAGADVQYASDKSYLQRYDISSLDQTTSRAYVEGFQGRDYAVLNSYYFQDLRAGTDVSEPVVLPSATVSMLGDPGQTLGGRWSFDGNTLITTRDNTGQSLAEQGPDTRRLSTNLGWQRQLTSDTGLVTTVSGLGRTDSYWADNVINVNSDGTDTVYNRALFTRQFEQANAVMRYPMGRSGDGYQQLMEPIVAVTAAPNVRQIAKQPNEDSLDTEFDETNLFSPNRFTGSDLIEGGSRTTYGIRNAITTDSGGRIDVFGGESYDFTTNSDFPADSGLNGHASDYVGRIDFAPVPWYNANYGFRLSQSDLSPQRQDAYTSIGVPIFRPYASYIEAYETDPTTELVEQVEQMTIGFTSTFAKYWTLNASQLQSFNPQPGPRNTSVTLNYVDECLAYGMTLSRDDTNRADISSGTSVSFHLFLKNLGGFHTDSVGGATFPAEFRQTDD
jgi:LPS-assembly protein